MKFTIQQTGIEKIVIGGIRGLLDFSDEEAVVGVRNGTIRVVGDRLEIAYFNQDEICLVGRIKEVHTEVSR